MWEGAESGQDWCQVSRGRPPRVQVQVPSAQDQDPGTPPEAAWEPIVRPSLTGHVGRVGAGVYNRAHICFAMPHG